MLGQIMEIDEMPHYLVPGAKGACFKVHFTWLQIVRFIVMLPGRGKLATKEAMLSVHLAI